MKKDKSAAAVFTITQPVITCSKLSIETLEQGVKLTQMFAGNRSVVNNAVSG